MSISSFVRVVGWYWAFHLAAVSVYLIVVSRSALVSDVSIGGGFVLSYRWFALGVGFGRSDWRWFRVNNVGPRSVLVLDVPNGGGFGHKRDCEYFDHKNKNAAVQISAVR